MIEAIGRKGKEQSGDERPDPADPGVTREPGGGQPGNDEAPQHQEVEARHRGLHQAAQQRNEQARCQQVIREGQHPGSRKEDPGIPHP